MARLNWDNVAAPDFSGAQSGLSSAAAMISQALAGAKSGLNEFEQIQDDKVNQAFALDLLKYQDPVAYKAALESGQLFDRPGADRISSANINAAGNRVGALLSQANTEFQMGRDKRLDGQAQAFDAAAPIVAQARALLGANKESEANALLAQHPEIFKGLGARDALNIVDGNQNALRDGLSILNTRKSMEQNDWRFGNEKADRQTSDLADAAFADVLGHANDPQSADAYIRSKGFAPKVEILIRSKLGLPNFQTYDVGDPLLGIGGSGVSGAIAFAAPQQAVANTLKSGGLSDNVVAGFLGNFHVEGGYTGNQGDGGSAGGIAQWRKERRVNFQKVIGVDPVKASPEQQAKFVLWELNNPAAAGMTPAQAAAIRNAKSPAEAAALIDQHFERSDGTARGGRVAAATNYAALLLGKASGAATTAIDNSNLRAGLNSDMNADTFAATQADNTPIAAVVENLRKAAFPNADKATILNKIAEVRARAAKENITLSNATAADMLARSVRGAPGFLERAGTLISSGAGGVGALAAAAFSGGGDLGDGTVVNMSLVDKMIQDAKPRKQTNGVVQSNVAVAASGRAMMDTQTQGLARANDALLKINAKIAQVEAANASGRSVSAGNLYAQKQQAEQIIQDLTNALRPQPQAPQRQAPSWPNSPVAVARPNRAQIPKAPPKPGWSLIR